MAINRVRLRIRTTALADVFTGCGKKISSSKLGAKAKRIISTYTWPRLKPTNIDYKIWAEEKQLPSLYTLDPKLNSGHSSAAYLYDTQNDMVYILNKTRWKEYKYQQ